MMERLKQPTIQRSLARRFVSRWAMVFMGLMLLACAEGVVFWWNGFRYRPPSAFLSVTASDLAVLPERDRVAVVVSFSQHSKGKGLWKDIVLMNGALENPVRLNVRRFAPRCVAMAPVSNRMVFAGESGKVFSLETPSGHQMPGADPVVSLFAETGGPGIERLVCSPDEKYLAAADRHSVFVWEFSTGRLIQRLPHVAAAFKSIQFSPDSQLLFSPRDSRGSCLWNVHTGEIVSQLCPLVARGSRTVWSFERQLLAGVVSGKLCVCRADARGGLWDAPASFSAPVVAFSPDGGLLAYARHDGQRSEIHICESESGAEVDRVDTHGSTVKGIAFSENGRLYAWDIDGDIIAWDHHRPVRSWSIRLFDWASRESVGDQ